MFSSYGGFLTIAIIVSEHDKTISQSQTADRYLASRGGGVGGTRHVTVTYIVSSWPNDSSCMLFNSFGSSRHVTVISSVSTRPND